LVPIAAWALWTGEWRRVAAALPWVAGTLLAAALAIPWYWAEERAAPGFLDYFLVGEHWKRFVEPGWKGDLYGAAHARPRGFIWLMWIAAALPWSIFALAWLGRAAASRRGDLRRLLADPWLCYLLLWATTPMLFFTLSGNVLATYVLPGLPAFALLLGELWRPGAAGTAARRLRSAVRVMLIACAVLAVAFAGGITVMGPRFEAVRSHKALVVAYDAARGDAAAPLVYVGDPPMSAEFYAHGTPRNVVDVAALRLLLAGATEAFLAVRAREVGALPPDIQARLAPIGDFGDYRLFRKRSG
jgi:4-amino-4-deoxy-L-arabinose transferase-like glycosyltransferase